MQVQHVTLQAPGDLYRNLNKRNLRSKDCFIKSIDWDTANFICNNMECQFILKGYGNYVSRIEEALLAAQVQLRDAISELTKHRAEAKSDA